MRTVLRLVGLVLAAAVFYLLVKPVPIDPLPWTPTPNPGLTGPFAPNSLLAAADQPAPTLGTGPEDLTIGPDGRIYTGLADGRIVRIDRTTWQVETFANTEGRPLGMRFDAAGNLIVADPASGVLAVAPSGNIRLLVAQAGSGAPAFTDALDIAPDGTIWFSDATSRPGDRRLGTLDYWESRPTGRLLSYDPASGLTKVHLDSLDFANGVAVGPRGDYVLVNETFTGRIHRLWLAGPRVGQRELFADGLPGMPDNISYDGKGTFWVGLVGPRAAELERIRKLPPFLRKVVYRIPERLRVSNLPRYGWVVSIDTTGQIRHNLQDPSGRFWNITTAVAWQDTLYLGSLRMTTIARLPVPSLR
jgi:sugar lactone lactonase YvrE